MLYTEKAESLFCDITTIMLNIIKAYAFISYITVNTL
jgi:hypothetical protein